MTTALDIIVSSLQNIGAIAIEAVPTAAEAQQALNQLNGMLETWSTESLTVYTAQPQVFPLQAGKVSYTMGPGGDFSTIRPIFIESVKIRDPNGFDFPTTLLTDAEYAALYIKTLTSTFPNAVYDDGNFPLKTLYFYPVANNANYSAVVWSWSALSQFPTLTTVFSFPPGYRETIEFNLSLRLGPKYGKLASQDLKDLAMSTKAQVMRNNTTTDVMTIDSRISGRKSMGQSLAQFTAGPYI